MEVYKKGIKFVYVSYSQKGNVASYSGEGVVPELGSSSELQF